MESAVPFVASDMPDATSSMLHTSAALAQDEGGVTGSRTKAAQAAARVEGAWLERTTPAREAA